MTPSGRDKSLVITLDSHCHKCEPIQSKDNVAVLPARDHGKHSGVVKFTDLVLRASEFHLGSRV